MSSVGARRILSFTFTPERAWRDACRADARHSVARHLGLLALLPAVVAALLTLMHSDFLPAAWLTPLASDSPFALALRGEAATLAVPLTPAAERASPLAAVAAALLTYVATWLTVASGAAILDVLMPLFCARRDYQRCMIVASYAATPLLLSSVALLHPTLVPIIAIAAMHACYVAYVGLTPMLGVPRAEAGVCLGIAVIAALVFGQVAGYGAGALLSAVAR